MNPLNNANNMVMDVVNKIPKYLYFAELPDRQQAIKYLSWLYDNIPEAKTIPIDKLAREVIAQELRIVSMKIIDVDILIMIALNNITLADFTIPSDDLIKRVIAENTDKYDLDTMYRVLAQIMTKLPRDLRDRVSGKHKLQIFQKLTKFINIDSKLMEKFMDYNPSINGSSDMNGGEITMEMNSGDYAALNKRYLQELYKYDKTQPYLDANSLEFGAMASKLYQSAPSTTQPACNSNGPVNAQYVDTSPDLMMGVKDKKLYYFDSSSGTLSDMPLDTSGAVPVSLKNLKTILASRKIDEDDIETAIRELNIPIPSKTESQMNDYNWFLDGLDSLYKGLFNGSTQAEASITTRANLNSNAPIPPAFLTRLYNIKNRRNLNDNYNTRQNNNLSQEYGYYFNSQMNSNVNPGEVIPADMSLSSNNVSTPANYSRYSSRPSATLASIIPNSTHRAFSGPIPNETVGITMPTTYLSSNNLNTRFKLLNSSYNHNPTTTMMAPTTTMMRPTTTMMAPTTTMMGPTTTMMTPTTTMMAPTTTMMAPTTTMMTPTTTMMAPTTTMMTPTTTIASVISPFANMSDSTPNTTVMAKIRDTNQKIENLAIGFITILILIFLIVIINAIRNYKK